MPLPGEFSTLQNAAIKEGKKEARRQRRAERRASRFMKEPIADAKGAESNAKGAGEDQPDGGLQNQAKTVEARYVKTKDGSLVAQSDSTRRYKPGFTPNSLYWLENVHNRGIAENGWYGDMLDAHVLATKSLFTAPQNTSDILGSADSNADPNLNPYFRIDLPHSKRDTLSLHNDSSTDYFLHDTILNSPQHNGIANGLPNNVTAEAMGRALLERYSSTGWENQDPVIYGFEVIIDAISSPLLNGGVEEFIDLYDNVSEIQSRRRVLYDFKMQFQKLFKTKGRIQFRDKENQLYEGEALFSDPNSSSINAASMAPQPQGSRTLRPGKKAYLSHYLYKIDGLHKLNESNLGETKKYITDWQKDFVKLTFNEDVSGTLSSLSHLYKMLYWSKPNQKHIVPENLLRFNCEIVVSEVRNFNRVRNFMSQTEGDKSLSSTSLQIIKDNVSRHVYSLRECQFYFDTPAHDDSIDLSSIKPYEGHTVQFDYKYSTAKYEKWVSDPRKFGRYVSYHNGALWKIGNRGARAIRQEELAAEGGTIVSDYSNPRFYTVGGNSLRQDGVKEEIELMTIQYMLGDQAAAEDFDESPDLQAVIFSGGGGGTGGNSEDDPDARTQRKRKRKKRRQDAFKAVKSGAKKAFVRAAKSAYESVKGEIKAQIGVRAQLLEDTINRLKNLVGLGGLETDPRNVYRRPYTPVGMGIFFDVRNELYNYWGEEISAILANASNVINPFGNQAIEGILPDKLKKANAPSVWFNPLNMLLKKYSSLPSVVDTSKFAFPNSAQKSPNPIAAQGDLEDILNANANFKPKNEGVSNNKLSGPYVNYDPNVGFGGNSVMPSSDNVKSKGSLDDILNANANFKPSEEGNGVPGSFTQFDPQLPKAGTNYTGAPKGFGINSSAPAASSTNQLLEKNANFKPSEEGNGVPGSFKAFDPQLPKGTTKGFGGIYGQGLKAQGSLEDILNSGAIFKPADEGVSKNKLAGKYIPKDPNVGFGGGASTDNIPAQGSLEDIVKKNTKWPYPFNDKKFPRDI